MGDEQRDVIVVGAGLAGLATGIFLRMNGYRARIFEQAPRPGGVALTRWTPGHTVEGGVYFFIEHAPGRAAYELYHALGIVPSDGVYTLDLFGRLVDEASGAVLDVTSDLDRLERDLLAIAPDDRAIVQRLVAGARGFAKTDPAKMGFEKPTELQGWWDKLALGWHARHVMGVFSDKELLEKPMSEWLAPMKSDAARRLIMTVFPHASIPAWFVMMLLGLLAQKQLGGVKGSADEFVGALTTRYAELGGELACGAAVRRIRVEDGRATGVELEDGTFHPAHAVVATVDTRQLAERLLDGKHTDGTTRERLASWPLTAPAAFVHFVTRGAWDEQPWMTQVRAAPPFDAAGAPSEIVTVRFFREGIAGAGPGESVVQFSCDADHAYWAGAGDARAERRARLEAAARERVERLAPGFGARVLRAETVLPDDVGRALRAPGGVTSAWRPTPAVINAPTPRTIDGVAGLYLAGQWAVGGAGILAVMYSGRHAANLICHADHRSFVAARAGA